MDGNISNKEIYALLQDIENKIETNKEELKQEFRNNNTEIRNKLDSLANKNKQLKEENKILKERVLAIERKTKKYNLVIYGVNESQSKTETKTYFFNLLSEKLNINCTHSDIRDYHRIGKKSKDKNRPIVVEFISYQLKQEILHSSKKFQGTGVFIGNEYISEEYQQRKVLRDNLKTARENNLEAYIKNNLLFVNGNQYTYEELKNHPIKILDDEVEEANNPEHNNLPQISQNRKTENSDIPDTPQQSSSREETNKFFINTIPKIKKRKEQPTEPENFIKRSNRLRK